MGRKRATVRPKPVTTAAIASSILSAILLTGCSSPQKQPSSSPSSAIAAKAPDGRDLRPVNLPDLSQMSPSAQKQIRDQYAALSTTIASRPDVIGLSAAYGEMGKLLMAA